jgi:hypothetical protein
MNTSILATINSNLVEHIARVRENAQTTLARCEFGQRLFGPLCLSDKADFNFFGSDVWVTTANRDDVAKVLALAPAGQHWTKSKAAYDETILRYNCVIDGIGVQLHVMDGALPPTCKVEEIEVQIPAQEARVEKRRVLVCPKPANADYPPHDEHDPRGDEAGNILEDEDAHPERYRDEPDYDAPKALTPTENYFQNDEHHVR